MLQTVSVFFTKTIVIHSFGQGMNTLTAVPGLTQPSTLRGIVK